MRRVLITLSIARWLVALALGGVGAWCLLTNDAWRLGEALSLAGLRDAAAPAHWALLGLLLAWPLLYPVRHLRPWLWLATVALGPLILLLGGSWLAAVALLLAMGLMFDPRWLPPHAPEQPEDVFYDGHCGLCHRTVRFAARRDPDGKLFRFAPLDGRHIRQALTPAQRDRLPDSVVVYTDQRAVRVRSEAVLHLLERIGGLWRVLAWLGRVMPRPIRDAAYDGIAAIRHRLFARPEAACPLTPPEWRGRFLT
jgi:predicted DCC family thiol-disulfide oxidoreductase YuxK